MFQDLATNENAVPFLVNLVFQRHNTWCCTTWCFILSLYRLYLMRGLFAVSKGDVGNKILLSVSSCIVSGPAQSRPTMALWMTRD